MIHSQLHNILDRLDYWIKESDKWQKATDDYVKVIAPSSYMPIIEDRYVQAFIDGVCQLKPELKEDLEYYTYDVSRMKKCIGTIRYKVYNLKNKDEYVQFVLDRK